MPLIVITLLLASIIGGATSIAAQSALPGYALWHFKTGINESMQSALIPDGRVQADFDIGIIETRIQESEKINKDYQITDRVRSEVEKNIAEHANSALSQIIKLQKSGDYIDAADMASRLQAALAKYPASSLNLQNMVDTASRLSEEASQQAKIF
jgi:hypothetical protein